MMIGIQLKFYSLPTLSDVRIQAYIVGKTRSVRNGKMKTITNDNAKTFVWRIAKNEKKTAFRYEPD